MFPQVLNGANKVDGVAAAEAAGCLNLSVYALDDGEQLSRKVGHGLGVSGECLDKAVNVGLDVGQNTAHGGKEASICCITSHYIVAQGIDPAWMNGLIEGFAA